MNAAYRRFVATAALGVFAAIVATIIAIPHPAISQSSTTPLTGWLWSDNTGWISLNCSDPGTCKTVNYSVAVDGSGNAVGWAWSDNVGWIEFGGLSGFPSGSGTTAANAKLVSGAFSGWARACAGTIKSGDSATDPTQPGDCSTMTSRPDGWDGWISLNGTAANKSPYQIVQNGAGTFKSCTAGNSCAWGSDVNGWVDASYAQYQCTSQQSYCQDATTLCTFSTQSCSFGCTACSYQCQNQNGVGACISPKASGTITAVPSIVVKGATTVVSWTAQNVENGASSGTACNVSGTNGDAWSSPAKGGTNTSSGSQTSSPITQQTIYTLTCTDLTGASSVLDSATVSIVPKFQEK